jgi:hypothetical protein
MSSLRFIIVCNEVQKRDSKTSINSFDYLDPKDNSTLDPINDGSSSDTCSEKELLKKKCKCGSSKHQRASCKTCLLNLTD